MDIFINSFDGGDGVWPEVLRFTNTTNNYLNLGDRLPAVFTYKDNKGYIIVISQIGDNNNYIIGGNIYLEEKTWYKLEIAQLSENSKVFLFLFNINRHLDIFCLISLFSIMLRSRLMEKSKVKGWKIQNLCSSQM